MRSVAFTAIPKPIEVQAFQFQAWMETRDLPEGFPREARIFGSGNHKQIEVPYGLSKPKYRIGQFFVQTRPGSPWRAVAASSFYKQYDIKDRDAYELAMDQLAFDNADQIVVTAYNEFAKDQFLTVGAEYVKGFRDWYDKWLNGQPRKRFGIRDWQ